MIYEISQNSLHYIHIYIRIMYIHIFYPPPLIKIPQPFVDTPRRNQWLAYAGIMTCLSYVVSLWHGSSARTICEAHGQVRRRRWCWHTSPIHRHWWRCPLAVPSPLRDFALNTQAMGWIEISVAIYAMSPLDYDHIKWVCHALLVYEESTTSPEPWPRLFC